MSKQKDEKLGLDTLGIIIAAISIFYPLFIVFTTGRPFLEVSYIGLCQIGLILGVVLIAIPFFKKK